MAAMLRWRCGQSACKNIKGKAYAELQGRVAVGRGRVHIYPTSLTLQKGTMNVLLGPTLSARPA